MVTNVADPYSGINPFGFSGRGGGMGGTRQFPSYVQQPPRTQGVGSGNKLPVPFKSRSLCESIHGMCTPGARGEWVPRSPLVGGKPLPAVVPPRSPIEGQVVGSGRRAVDSIPTPRQLPPPKGKPSPNFTGPPRPPIERGRGPQGPGRKDYADNIWRSKDGKPPINKAWCKSNPKACSALIAGGAYILSDMGDEEEPVTTKPPPRPPEEPPTVPDAPPPPPPEERGIFGSVRDWMTDPTLTATGLSNAQNLSRLGQLLSYATGTNTRSQPAAWTDPSKNPARQWAKDEYYRSQATGTTKWAFCDPGTGRCFNKTTGQWEMPPNISGTVFQGKRPEPTTGDRDVAKAILTQYLNKDDLTDKQKWAAGAIADQAKAMSERSGGRMTYQEAVAKVIEEQYIINPETAWWFGDQSEITKRVGKDLTKGEPAIKAPQRPIRAVGPNGDMLCSYDDKKTWNPCK